MKISLRPKIKEFVVVFDFFSIYETVKARNPKEAYAKAYRLNKENLEGRDWDCPFVEDQETNKEYKGNEGDEFED